MKLKKIFRNVIYILVITEILIICSIVNNKTQKLLQGKQVMLAESKTINFNNQEEKYFLKTGKNDEDMQNNTNILQEAIDEVSNAGGGKIIMPSGTYYFKCSPDSLETEHWIVKCKNNVTIIGQGKEGENATILKPYGEVKNGGIDMFFFNNYILGTPEDETLYLENVHFKGFAIDGAEATGEVYNSSGKGFMINLFKNCTWDNILVQNTDGTGFGIDCPINSAITNCIARNCGKTATENNVGASGFGIGTGYSNDEEIYIYNCEAYNNKKYGFFFEHQSRFFSEQKNKYTATKADGFVVSNCIASGNLYDFGGARANDVTYENCTSKGNECTSSMHFENFSVRTHIVNFISEKIFDGVNTNSNEIKWALFNGIIEGESKNELNIKGEINRATAVELLYRMSERQEDVFLYNVNDWDENKVKTSFSDVDGKKEYAKAIKWAEAREIAKGNSTNAFSPLDACTRANFVMFLYRYAGSPDVTVKEYFSDVSSTAYYAKALTWAYENGIVNGSSEKIFSPDDECTKLMAITMLYRYEQADINRNCNITYNLQGGTVTGNPETYCSGKDRFTLNNPTKTGYIFTGWTGSNIEEKGYDKNIVPNKNVEIKITDKGNKTYTANWSCEHNWKEATCETAKTCERCGQEEGEALGHSWKEATCKTAKMCERCGKVEGKAKGHTEVTDEAVAPTCTETGLTEGKHCSVCNQVIQAQTKVAALGHNYKETVTKPTTTSQGYTTHTCTRCGDSYKDSYTAPIAEPESLYVASNTYNVGDKYISKIKPETTVKTLKEKLLTNEKTEVVVKNNGTTLKETDYIGTGMKIIFKLGEKTEEYTLVVTGDLTGDGKLQNGDLIKLVRYRVELITLEEPYKLAADVNGDGKVADSDIIKLARALVEIK